MSKVKLESRDANQFTLSGELTFDTAQELFDQAARIFSGKSRVTVDLSDINRVDSAGLALLMEWLRVARREKVELEFRNLPAQMTSLIMVSGLQELFPGASR